VTVLACRGGSSPAREAMGSTSPPE
jgi:hypothetical protein